MFDTILLIVLVFILLLNIFFYFAKRKHKVPEYHVKAKFAHGIKTKLTLNDDQYEKFRQFLNHVDGYFEIGDENDHVKIYREFICAVEVKRK